MFSGELGTQIKPPEPWADENVTETWGYFE